MSNSKHTCQIFHFDLYGTRQQKYEFLQNNNLHSVEWQELKPQDPSYFFVPKDFSLQKEYEKGFRIDELMKVYAKGLVTQRDEANVAFTKAECEDLKKDFLRLEELELKQKYGKESRDWKISFAQNDIKHNAVIADRIAYRPFDLRYTNYTGKTKGIMSYPRFELMKHMLKDNLCIIANKTIKSDDITQYFICNNIADSHILETMNATANFFPLYLYPKEGSIDTERVPNLDEGIVRRIMEATASPQLQGRHQQHLRDADDSPQLQGRRQEHLRDADASRIYFDKTDFKYLHWATKLPHWHQDGKYVFVTFRLTDSLPQAKLKELKEEKEIWLKNHPKP